MLIKLNVYSYEEFSYLTKLPNLLLWNIVITNNYYYAAYIFRDYNTEWEVNLHWFTVLQFKYVIFHVILLFYFTIYAPMMFFIEYATNLNKIRIAVFNIYLNGPRLVIKKTNFNRKILSKTYTIICHMP